MYVSDPERRKIWTPDIDKAERFYTIKDAFEEKNGDESLSVVML